ncbi:hypothetical protein OH460_07925 [Vibrio sp. Makdt]|uniref:hypothetical protein n=1 Tax=Vibrio sp. Makdt TaxID=2998828 RepID=UPI0022CD2A27|nr:hypothetical protein [Vibrio sp. Makdt]MDA0152225.1 hypothetical protein [Vibrio sp. Makdt]
MFGLLDRFKTKPATTDELIQAWIDNPVECLQGQFDHKMEWDTCYGLAPMEGLPDTHGYSMFPDLKVTIKVRKTEVDIGWVERISMYSGGTVRVRHFALDPRLSGQNYGGILLKSIIDLLKANNAIKIEFHETHITKLEHYRKLFTKYQIEEISKGVWCVNLYEDGKIPQQVQDFQASLLKE